MASITCRLIGKFTCAPNLTFRTLYNFSSTNIHYHSAISSLFFLNDKVHIKQRDLNHRKTFSVSCVNRGSAARAETTTTTQGLSKLQAQELILRLTSEEREILINAIQEFHSKMLKDQYEGELV